MLAELVDLFESGALQPLPIRVLGRAPGGRGVPVHVAGPARREGRADACRPSWVAGGTVLVTGGTGTLGGLVARHLVAGQGVRDLLLVSRRGPAAADVAGLAAALAGSGARVRVAACDVADREALAGVLAGLSPEHPLTGVVHAAGVLDDGVVTALTPERVAVVMRAKVDAVLNLHELTAGADLSAFVVFSSAAGVLGTAGQGNYAAANACPGRAGSHPPGSGLAGTSLAWGLWEQASGMTGHLNRADRYRMTGAGSGRHSLTGGPGVVRCRVGHGRSVAAPGPLGHDGIAVAATGCRPLLRGLVRVPTRRVAACR